MNAACQRSRASSARDHSASKTAPPTWKMELQIKKNEAEALKAAECWNHREQPVMPPCASEVAMTPQEFLAQYTHANQVSANEQVMKKKRPNLSVINPSLFYEQYPRTSSPVTFAPASERFVFIFDVFPVFQCRTNAKEPLLPMTRQFLHTAVFELHSLHSPDSPQSTPTTARSSPNIWGTSMKMSKSTCLNHVVIWPMKNCRTWSSRPGTCASTRLLATCAISTSIPPTTNQLRGPQSSVFVQKVARCLLLSSSVRSSRRSTRRLSSTRQKMTCSAVRTSIQLVRLLHSHKISTAVKFFRSKKFRTTRTSITVVSLRIPIRPIQTRRKNRLFSL